MTSTRAALDSTPVIVVSGMAFEARIARGDGVMPIYASRADRLERLLTDALARGARGILSFGTAGGLAPALGPGTVIVATAVDGPAGRVETNAQWTARIATALAASPLVGHVQRGLHAAVSAPLPGAAGKAALHRAGGALAVDMESHVAAAFAQRHRLPFAVCRAILDPATLTLPPAALAGFGSHGKVAFGAVLRELLREPTQLGALLRLAAHARTARTALLQARHALARAQAWSPA